MKRMLFVITVVAVSLMSCDKYKKLPGSYVYDSSYNDAPLTIPSVKFLGEKVKFTDSEIEFQLYSNLQPLKTTYTIEGDSLFFGSVRLRIVSFNNKELVVSRWNLFNVYKKE